MQVQIRNHRGDRANSLVFVRALLRNPRQLAAVAPSSRVPAGLMIQGRPLNAPKAQAVDLEPLEGGVLRRGGLIKDVMKLPRAEDATPMRFSSGIGSSKGNSHLVGGHSLTHNLGSRRTLRIFTEQLIFKLGVPPESH